MVPVDKEIDELGLAVRSGLPDELKVLLASYPRSMWRGHANMGALTRFWLSRHNGFRRAMEMLTADNDDYLEGKIPLETFARTLVPPLNGLLGALHSHHTIEDHHYFPRFRAAEARLARGFDLLDSDHHAMHEAMEGVARAANALLATEPDHRDSLLTNSEAFALANQRLFDFLFRHLHDEEDLIVPILLDRGEGEWE